MWTPQELNPDVPLYRAIAAALERDVARGVLAPGERLPTHRDLARALKVNVMTVTRAYAAAGQRGLVTGEVGRGTFVRGRDRSAPAVLPEPADEATLVDLGYSMPCAGRELLDVETALAELSAAPAGRSARGRELLFASRVSAGLRAHRSAGADWIRRHGLAADVERVVVTSGAQHGLTVALAALCAPGDTVLTEELTQPGIRALTTALRLRLEGVRLDPDGLDPAAFEAACKKLAPKVLVTTPTVQDPTGAVAEVDRRRALAAVARRYGVWIVEDDSNAYLCADAPPPLASFAPEQSYYLLGLAKSVAPGLRIGFLLAPTVGGPTGIVVERLASMLAALTGIAGLAWMASPLMGELAARWIRGGVADAVVAARREECAVRRRLYDGVFGGGSPAHPSSSHVWLELSGAWSSEALAREARHHGVALIGSDAFRAGGPSRNGDGRDGVRLCLATPETRAELEKALRALASILACTPGSARLARVPRVERHVGPF